MPEYQINPTKYDLPREAVILDTNVLVALFHKEDDRFEDSKLFVGRMREQSRRLVVPIAVLIEAWGVLTSRCSGNTHHSREMFAWVIYDSNAILISDSTAHSHESYVLSNQTHTDAVDAIISLLAEKVTKQCRLNQPMPIATFDARHLLQCAMARGVSARIYDPSHEDPYEIEAPS